MNVIGISGFSGSGKTTLVERLIPLLRARRQRVSVVKHAHHSFNIDHQGKDTWRHREAGAFEVVVTYTEAGTHATAIKVYSWKDNLLQPIKLSGLDQQQQQGYRGDDEVAVKDGKLLRLFQIYEQQDGEWAATAAQRKLHYSFDSSRWMTD